MCFKTRMFSSIGIGIYVAGIGGTHIAIGALSIGIGYISFAMSLESTLDCIYVLCTSCILSFVFLEIYIFFALQIRAANLMHCNMLSAAGESTANPWGKREQQVELSGQNSPSSCSS